MPSYKIEICLEREHGVEWRRAALAYRHLELIADVSLVLTGTLQHEVDVGEVFRLTVDVHELTQHALVRVCCGGACSKK